MPCERGSDDRNIYDHPVLPMRAPFRLIVLSSLLCVALGAPSALAQVTVEGRVTDAETGEPLPQANLRVKGTYTGTITNERGRYTLAVDSLPATVLVRYIGYESAQIRITEDTDPRRDVALAPSTVAMEEVVVTGNDNPGRRIMRKVIEQKQTWWDSLDTYAVDAYGRYTLSNDTGVVAVYETQTRAFWDRERGTREVVRARRQTKNLGMMEDALPAASSVLNLYRDNVTVAGSDLMGVTHPDALDRYTFTLDTVRVRDGKKVYDIRVEPENRLASAFAGRVSVLDSAYAMIEADLRPAQSLRLPRVVKSRSLTFEQQFSNFGGAFWLPVDFRAERQFELALSAFVTIPRMVLDQVVRLDGYEINGPLPDSLYAPDADRVVAGTRVQAASPTSVDSIVVDSLGADGPFVPLSDDQKRAYARRDSAQSLSDAFQPQGLLGSVLDLSTSEDGVTLGSNEEDEAASDTTGASADSSQTGLGAALDMRRPRPHLWYNRVEGPHVGGRASLEIAETVTVGVRGGHSFFLEEPGRWSYGGSVETRLPTDVLDRLTVKYRYGVDPRYESKARLFPPLTRGVNSLWTLFGEPDYYDYFGNERLRVGLATELPNTDFRARLQYRTERHFSVTEVNDYNVLGRSTVFKRRTRQPPNPSIADGRLRSLHLRLAWGDDPRPRGVLPVDRVELAVEHTGDWLQSDFSFTRGEVAVDARVETFFRRRALPTALDVRAVAGGALGTLPLQRFGVVEAGPLPFTPFGALRTLDDRPYQGTAHAAFFWEHNFRTVPFELLGLYGLADRHIGLILHGGHGRTWMGDERQTDLRRKGVFVRTSDGMHHEVGLSVNGVLRDLLRVDFTARLDRRVYSIGVSLLRFI